MRADSREARAASTAARARRPPAPRRRAAPWSRGPSFRGGRGGRPRRAGGSAPPATARQVLGAHRSRADRIESLRGAAAQIQQPAQLRRSERKEVQSEVGVALGHETPSARRRNALYASAASLGGPSSGYFRRGRT